jgi:hypothetical protein
MLSLEAVSFVVEWIVVPLMLLGILGLATVIAYVYFRELRTELGLWLGVAVFILVVVLDQFAGPLPSLSGGVLDSAFVSVLLGLSLGSLTMFVVHKIGDAGAAILSAALASGSLTALFYYLARADEKSPLMFATVAYVIGALLYGVLVPGSLKVFERGVGTTGDASATLVRGHIWFWRARRGGDTE